MYTCADVMDILDLPVELDATVISGRDGCYSEDIEDYIERVKNESLEILRDGLHQLDFHTEN